MDEVVITWSLENWITVLLMVALGYGVAVVITKLVKGHAAKSAGA